MKNSKSKIVVINSYGPMGSSLLASIIEKFGFGNTPVRKLGLNEYLMSHKSLMSKYMETRILKLTKDHQKPLSIGGVSVLDRDKNEKISLISNTKFNQNIENFLKTEIVSISQLYFHCRSFYDDCICYKQRTNKANQQIELSTNSLYYDPEILYERYRENFDEVYIINLTRDFSGWINSMASQSMSHQNLKNRLIFAPHKQYNQWKNYNNHISRVKGLHIEFNQLFDDPVEKLIPTIASYLKMPEPSLNFKNETFDLYGRLKNYKDAFSPYDDNNYYLSKKTLKKYSNIFLNSEKVSIIDVLLVRLFYIKDMIKFRFIKS